MGIAKKTDGRYVVGVGVDNANDYKGSASYRDIYIQLTASGATEKSEEYLTFLKDYAVNANALGEPIMPPSVNVWISNNGVTTAVEADDVSIDGSNYTICGIKWDGSTWDYSNAGQGSGGGSGSGLPSYTSADIGKVLTVGEASPVETEVVVVPEQTGVTVEYGVLLSGVDFSALNDNDVVNAVINNVHCVGTFVYNNRGSTIVFPDNNYQINQDLRSNEYTLTAYGGGVLTGDYTVSATAVQSVTPSVQTVIVPEQTVTLVGESPDPVPLSNADFSGVSVGTPCVLTVGENSENLTFESEDGMLFVFGELGAVTYSAETGAMFGTSAGTYTVSLTTSVPLVEPKWEAAGGAVVFDATSANGNISSEVTYADIDAAYSDGTKPIVLRVLYNGNVFELCPLIVRDSTSFSFFCLAYNGAGLTIGRYSITQANVWSYTTMTINGTWS